MIVRRILLCLAQYLYCTIALAQIREIDSLNKILPSLKGNARIECLNELSYACIQALKKDSAIYYATKAFEEAIKLNNPNGIAVSLSYQAEIAFRLEADFIKAVELGKESLKWYERTTDVKGLDNLYILLWTATFAQSKYDEAIHYAEKRYELLKRAGNKTGIWNALHMKAIVYKESGNFEKSFYYNCQAYEIASNHTTEFLPLTLFIFAELYMQIGEYATSLNYFRQAFLLNNSQSKKILHSSGWIIWVKMEYAELFSRMHQFDSAWHYYALFKPSNEEIIFDRIYLISTGECYFLQKKFSIALENFLKGLAMHRKLNDVNQVMRGMLDIAKTYAEMGRDSLALTYGREGLAIAVHKKARQYMRDGYQILSRAYDRLHQTDSANFYFRQYITMKEEVLNDQAKGKFVAYNYEQKLALMNKEKQIQQARLEKESIVKKVLIGGIAFLFLFGLTVFRNISLKRKNEKQKLEHKITLQKAENDRTSAEFQQQTTELELQALRAQMNPHFIFNSLNAINRFILQNNKLQASEYLTKFSKLVRLILHNSQTAFISLANELEALQLYLELEALRFDHRFDYTIMVDENIDPSVLTISPLLIQPYAENAIWHGLMHKPEKGHLDITLFLQEQGLLCKITDDGVGRQKAAALKSQHASIQKSMGMKITASRIALLNQGKQLNSYITVNDLILPDGSAGGTEVILKIPVHYD